MINFNQPDKVPVIDLCYLPTTAWQISMEHVLWNKSNGQMYTYNGMTFVHHIEYIFVYMKK